MLVVTPRLVVLASSEEKDTEELEYDELTTTIAPFLTLDHYTTVIYPLPSPDLTPLKQNRTLIRQQFLEEGTQPKVNADKFKELYGALCKLEGEIVFSEWHMMSDKSGLIIHFRTHHAWRHLEEQIYNASKPMLQTQRGFYDETLKEPKKSDLSKRLAMREELRDYYQRVDRMEEDREAMLKFIKSEWLEKNPNAGPPTREPTEPDGV